MQISQSQAGPQTSPRAAFPRAVWIGAAGDRGAITGRVRSPLRLAWTMGAPPCPSTETPHTGAFGDVRRLGDEPQMTGAEHLSDRSIDRLKTGQGQGCSRAGRCATP